MPREVDFLLRPKAGWDACGVAAGMGHVEWLRELHEKGAPLTVATFSWAVEGGDVRCVEYLHDHGCPHGDGLMLEATLHSTIECLTFLVEHGYTWEADDMTNVVEAGRVDRLQWMHEHGCPWPYEHVWSSAIREDQVECLEYLLTHGCPVPGDVCTNAAYYIRPRYLEMLRNHGCAWDVCACADAVVEDWYWWNDTTKPLNGITNPLEGLRLLQYLHRHDLERRWGKWSVHLPAIVVHVLLPRWRALVRVRSIALFWQEETQKRLCAPGGVGRKRDLAAFQAFQNP